MLNRPLSTDENQRLLVLASEYVELVEAMREGRYADDEEWRQLSSQRTVVHDELIQLTGLEERPAMYGYCRQVLSEARAG